MSDGRGAWKSQLGFLMAAVGSAIGLGNIWRFAYMTFENGGGAFLIPYFTALFVAGIPLLILEYGLGHKKHASGPLAFAKISRRWEWLGWWMPVFAFFGIMLYYTVIIAWCVNFVGYSFGLSWGDNTENFFLQQYLQVSGGPFDLVGLVKPVVFALVLVWGLVWLISIKEVQYGIEKACFLFMPLLFILTAILVVWSLTLPGAFEGIKYYLKPDFSKLMDYKVWIDAFAQIFFSLTLAFGVMIAYASYLPKKTNITQNAILTGVINCGFSVFAGFAVFGTLGYMAGVKGVPVTEVVKGGPILAFVVYPEAISRLPALNRVFGVIFFSSLVIAGISSAISLVETVVCSIRDKFDLPRAPLVTGLCIVGFLGSLLFATHAGLLWLDIVDHYLSSFGLVLAGILECIAIGWCYKIRVFRIHVATVSDWGLPVAWEYLVRFVTPLVLAVILYQNFMGEFEKNYGDYSTKALVLLGGCWLIATLVVGIALAAFKWDRKKLEYDHFAEEDKLLV